MSDARYQAESLDKQALWLTAFSIAWVLALIWLAPSLHPTRVVVYLAGLIVGQALVVNVCCLTSLVFKVVGSDRLSMEDVKILSRKSWLVGTALLTLIIQVALFCGLLLWALWS